MTITSNSNRVVWLRPPQAGDEQILFDYARELEAEDTFVLLNSGQPVTWSEEVNYLKSALEKINAGWQVHYLVFHEGKMIGSAQISKQGRRKMHVGNFGISLLPAYRHDGLGEKLANWILAEAKTKLQLSLVTLEVFGTNEVAQGLYGKLGFLEYGRLENGLRYQSQYVDSVLMCKRL